MKKESLKFSIHNLIIDAIVAGAGIRACTIARRRAVAVRKVLEMRFIAEYSKESGFASVAEDTPAWFASHVLAKDAEI